uniref:plasmid replication initiator RepA n=1 Tax=Buchnera aphidicola TaxID=9 RepID=UPI003F5D4924
MKKIFDKNKKDNILNRNILFINKINGKILSRRRCLNKHRVQAIKAVIEYIIYHLDINSNYIKIPIKQISDECGLSTFSKSGKKSISRISRLITEFMEPMGLIKIKKEKNKINNIISKKIILTPLFFLFFRIKKEKIINTKEIKNKVKNKKIKKNHTCDEKRTKKKILYSIINRYSTEELTEFGSNGLKKMVDKEYFNLKKEKK